MLPELQYLTRDVNPILRSPGKLDQIAAPGGGFEHGTCQRRFFVDWRELVEERLGRAWQRDEAETWQLTPPDV